MCYDRISSIDNFTVITAFIEHSYINTEDICIINGASHSTFVRTDNHKVVSINLEVIDIFKESFYKLVCRLDRFKTL